MVLAEPCQKLEPEVAKQLKRLDKMVGMYSTQLQNCPEETQPMFEEFNDNMALYYGVRANGLPHQCNKCGKKFTV